MREQTGGTFKERRAGGREPVALGSRHRVTADKIDALRRKQRLKLAMGGLLHAAHIGDETGGGHAGIDRGCDECGHCADRHAQHHQIGAFDSELEIIGGAIDAEGARIGRRLRLARPKPHARGLRLRGECQRERSAEQSAAKDADVRKVGVHSKKNRVLCVGPGWLKVKKSTGGN